jgi:UDP-N-acetylmuramoylalanine-D-glutamate ligase
MRVRFSKTAVTVPAASSRTTLHLGGTGGMKIRIAAAKPIPVDPVVPAPSVELTERDKELVRTARVHREIDRLVRDFNLFRNRMEILDSVIDLMQFGDDGVLTNTAAVHNAVEAIIKGDRSAVMTNESARGFK